MEDIKQSGSQVSTRLTGAADDDVPGAEEGGRGLAAGGAAQGRGLVEVGGGEAGAGGGAVKNNRG